MSGRAIFGKPNGGWKTKAKGKAKRAPRPRPDPKPIDDIVGLPAGPRVIVPFPAVELSPNWRGHWSKKSPIAAAYRKTCWALALEAKLKVPDYAGKDGKIYVQIDFFPPNRNSRDDDNVPASFKSGRDGVADAMRVDDARFVTTPVQHEEPRSCVVVTLITPEGNG